MGRGGSSWVELGGGGWSWVEVGARFSNTQNLTHFTFNIFKEEVCENKSF